ncbi:hypothetical protein BC629DRAFT_812478 [Irpex lacteus]|nr:hypothetical protein BC629DRAFT_812478 [Irpex lacteus]
MSGHIPTEFATTSLFNVEGWTVLVTGGGTGIGLMIAQAFANNGARVYIVGRRSDVLLKSAETWGAKLANSKGQLIPLTADINSKESIQILAEEIKSKEKKLDVLVNNAGVHLETSNTGGIRAESPEALKEFLWDHSWDDWETTYRTNVIGHFFTTIAFLPLLTAAKRPDYTPSVINVSSIAGITRTTRYCFMYSVSKAASIHLNTLLAQELRKPGVEIRVNSIAPGVFPSQMTSNVKDESNKSHIFVNNDYRERMGIPEAVGRPGSETDIAQTALFLACNQYLYGQTIVVDGGHLLENP